VPLLDLVGQRFGRLVVQARAPSISRAARWECLCDCGGRKVAIGDNLRRHLTTSCGCAHREATSAATKTHGLSRTATYNTWRSMLARCDNATEPCFHNYGGRGISVCDAWRSFDQFYADMGPRPSPSHSIDRINVDGNYEPGNCRWATASEQARNTRANRVVTHDGICAPLVTHCDRLGLSYQRVHQRLTRGWSVDRALQP
jgi:hypothetical protein